MFLDDSDFPQKWFENRLLLKMEIEAILVAVSTFWIVKLLDCEHCTSTAAFESTFQTEKLKVVYLLTISARLLYEIVGGLWPPQQPRLYGLPYAMKQFWYAPMAVFPLKFLLH